MTITLKKALYSTLFAASITTQMSGELNIVIKVYKDNKKSSRGGSSRSRLTTTESYNPSHISSSIWDDCEHDYSNTSEQPLWGEGSVVNDIGNVFYKGGSLVYSGVKFVGNASCAVITKLKNLIIPARATSGNAVKSLNQETLQKLVIAPKKESRCPIATNKIKNEAKTKQELFKRPEILENYEKLNSTTWKLKNGGKGIQGLEQAEYIEWNASRNTIEVYNANRNHVGSLNPQTLEIIPHSLDTTRVIENL